MTPRGFVVAMRALIRPCAGDAPFLTDNGIDPRWLIVSRWGSRGRYVTLSCAVRQPGEPTDAPAGMHPAVTLFGELALDDAQEGSVFLLARSLPEGMRVAGRFCAAEGFVRLHHTHNAPLHLDCIVRLCAEADEAGSRPAPTWHVVAEHAAWVGECRDG